ncbi:MULTISPECIES: multidrug effflux MFS transporter [unclassified Rhizobium]|uniref:multidrug effflux MFS transporter n=1 Tax=unclassified Rhizobium TaxID=2613769 RepID=UPI000646FD42|nr:MULTISPECIES: multidrug effflux MFS transporter [unclassified Rhizobium]MBN8952719.1 multidrug effflux MFS transporter [Rhizobium tropici]OJY71489.1 MAG: Bcr/CflA family drug resistance efflux transporter [Rhizobium sp. 60-20]RKD55210.1 putative MFS family arabinose efflux permease [Rhizobium sp. WW_1]
MTRTERSSKQAIDDTTVRQAATQPRLTTLILLSALAVLPVNMILPSLPKISTAFHADFALVNLSVAGFSIVTAFLEAIGGAISDRFGRRPVVLTALAIFIVASIGCVLAPDIGTFLVFRSMQACIGPCYSVALVIIKETSDEREAASKFGYLAMGWALAPMVGPLFGGSLDEFFGWRASFVVLAILGIAAFLLSMRELKGSKAPTSNGRRNYLASYGQLLSSTQFWAYTLCMACSMGVLYIFLGGAPLTIGDALGGSSAMLGFYMGLVPAGFILGSYLAGRYGAKIPLGTILVIARLLTCIGLAFGLALSLSGMTEVLALFGPCVFIGIGNGLTMPAANSGAMSVRSDMVGTAAGLAAAMRISGGALIGSIGGLFIAQSATIHTLFVLMLVSALLALLAAIWATLIEKRR